MKKRRLKPFVKVSILGVFLIVCLLSVVFLTDNNTNTVSVTNDDFTYVNDYIFDSYYPVVKEEEKIGRPYTADGITIYKNFYDKDATEEEQQNSIIYHEGIYMQNSGVDYQSNEMFDVVASLSGTVTNVTEDTLLGNTVEIRNSNEIIVMYQSLGEVLVKKGDTVTQGQVIAKSGTCSLNSDVKQGLHFEMYKNGSVINPEKYYDKSIKDLVSN
jgi:stage II sporulation protein Q